jgi:uroporphyrinogen-III decarboxylase
MSKLISSKERLLTAIESKEPDHVPLSFMIFTALRRRLKLKYNKYDPLELVNTQLELGMDAMVDLRTFAPENKKIGHADAPGFPVHFNEKVSSHEWAEVPGGNMNPILHKKYETPAGDLSVVVKQTYDWPYGNAAQGKFHVPFMDDYLAPRSRKYLIREESEVEALKFLLDPPSAREIKQCHEAWNSGKKLAEKNDLLLAGGWGVGGDALAWFCGLENAVYMALENPELLKSILDIIHQWNISRMKVYLEYGIDLFVRRAWYEGTDFWSPDLFLEFFAPYIKQEVKLAHEAGVKYGYILTSGSAPLHNILIDLGIDVLMGVDPVQGRGTELEKMKTDLQGEICLWGGVNGFITIETGDRKTIEKAVDEALDTLGPDGCILSPVDNVRDPSDQVWDNVLIFINAWKKYYNL